jgi:hypothetical protein
MDLYLAEPNLDYSILRLESQKSNWEMGIYPTLYGTRVSCGRIGSQLYLKGGYCCGTSPTLLMEATLCISTILSSFPELATMHDVESVLPDWNLRPINLDDGIDKLRTVFQERLALSETSKPMIDSENILNALEDVCKNLDKYRLDALTKSFLG